MSASKLKALVIPVLGGIVGGLTIAVLEDKGGATMAPLRDAISMLGALTFWDVLVLPLLYLFAIVVHEAGHVAFGLGRGMRFLMFVAGPFGIVRVGERLQGRTFFNLGAFAGFAMVLPDASRPLKGQMIPMVLGGPLASLVLAIVAGTGAAMLDGRAAAWLLVLAFLSTLLFLVSAIPSRIGGMPSDGKQFVGFLRDPDFLRRRAYVNSLVGLSFTGTRPRALDGALLADAQAETGHDALYDIATWLFSYYHALDAGDVAAADAWLARIEPVITQYPDGFRQSIAVEFALFEALHRRRADVAGRWLDGARGGVVDASRRALAQAALAAARGDRDGAAAHLADAERALPRALDPGLGLLSRDQIAALRGTAIAA